MKTIILVRHGEKSISDKIHLSENGKIRANAFCNYFDDEFFVPECIYAMRQYSCESSNRCLETVTPLSTYLSIPLLTPCNHSQIDLLVACVKSDIRNTILICWEHHMIPSIAELFGFPTSYWGFQPFSCETHECYDATWVLNKNKLSIYTQFQIINNKPVYNHSKAIPVFTWSKPHALCCSR